MLIRFSLIILILCSQASNASAYPKRIAHVVAATLGTHAVFYGISAYQDDGARELENMGRWEWDLIYGFMRATMKILPKRLKASLGKKDYDELYEKITKVQFSHTEGELIPGISERLTKEGLVESGDVLAHPLNGAPNWAVKFFLGLGIALEDYAAYTHWSVYQASAEVDGKKRKGRVIDFDTRTEPRTPSLEKYLLERAEQGKKFLWIFKPRKKELIGMTRRISHILTNDGTDYRLAHASPNFRDTLWRGDNCESLSYELATGTAYSEQSAALRAFTYVFTTTAVTIASVIVYRCLFTQAHRKQHVMS